MDYSLKHRRPRPAVLGSAVLLLASASAAPAQERTAREMDLVAPFSACGSIEDDAERLACFDAALGDLPQAQTEAAVREDAEIIAGFGLPAREAATVPAAGAEQIEATSSVVREEDEVGIASRVAEVFTAVGRRSVILLENGQLWREGANSSRNVSARAGALATITPAPFGGGYRMKFEGRSGYLSVLRIR